MTYCRKNPAGRYQRASSAMAVSTERCCTGSNEAVRLHRRDIFDRLHIAHLYLRRANPRPLVAGHIERRSGVPLAASAAEKIRHHQEVIPSSVCHRKTTQRADTSEFDHFSELERVGRHRNTVPR